MRARSRPSYRKHRFGLTYAREIRICPNHRQRIGVGVARRSDRRQNGCRLNSAGVKPLTVPERDCAPIVDRRSVGAVLCGGGKDGRDISGALDPQQPYPTIRAPRHASRRVHDNLDVFAVGARAFLVCEGARMVRGCRICDKTIPSTSVRQPMMPTPPNGPGRRVLHCWCFSHCSERHGRWSQFCSWAWVGSRAGSVR
jgi:hypothetical protein